MNYLYRYSRIIGLDLPYFLKNGFFVSARYGIVSVCGLLISIGFARMGSKEIFGQYQSVLSILGVLSVFSLPGLNMAAYKAIVSGNERAVVKAVKYSFYSSFFAIPIIIGYAFYTKEITQNILIFPVLLLSALIFPFLMAPNTWSVFYEARSDFSAVSIRVIFQNLITAVAILTALYLQTNLFILLSIYFLCTIFFNWLFFYEVRVKAVKSDVLNRSLDFRYALIVTTQKFVVSLSENVPILAVAFLFGFEFLAIFQIANFAMSTVISFFSGLSAIYMPILFQGKTLNYYKIIFQNLILGLFLFAVFRFFLHFFFIFLYGGAYQESLYIAQILSFLIVVAPLKLFLLNYLMVLNKNISIMVVYFIGNVFALLLMFLTKDVSSSFSASLYLYSLNIFLLISLLPIYLWQQKK